MNQQFMMKVWLLALHSRPSALDTLARRSFAALGLHLNCACVCLRSFVAVAPCRNSQTFSVPID